MEGMRKWWMAFAAIAGIALIVLIVLAFQQYTEGLGKAAVLACAGIFGGYGTANVATKKIVGKQAKR